MLATGGPSCPVKLLKTYLAHRPGEMRNSDQFYLAVIEKRKLWYKCCTRNSVGVNKIDSLIKEIWLIGSGIGREGKKVKQSLGRKYACEEAEGFKSAKKCNH